MKVSVYEFCKYVRCNNKYIRNICGNNCNFNEKHKNKLRTQYLKDIKNIYVEVEDEMVVSEFIENKMDKIMFAYYEH